MSSEIEIMLLANPQLIVIIIQTFLGDSYKPGRFLQSPFLAIMRRIMKLPPPLYKFYNFANGPLATPLLPVVVLGLAALGGVVVVVVGVVGVLDHEDLELEVLAGDGERVHVQIVVRELDVVIGFGVVNFEYFLVGLWYRLEQFLQVHQRPVNGDFPLYKLGFVGLLVLDKKCFFLHHQKGPQLFQFNFLIALLNLLYKIYHPFTYFFNLGYSICRNLLHILHPSPSPPSRCLSFHSSFILIMQYPIISVYLPYSSGSMDNKLKVISVVATAAAGLLAYMLIKKSNNPPTHEETLQTQLLSLRTKITPNKTSRQDFQKVLELGIQQAKYKLNNYSKIFKEKRRKFTASLRRTEMERYMDFLYQGVCQMERIGLETLWDIGRRVGISQGCYGRYQGEVEKSLREIMEGVNSFAEQQAMLTMEQTKSAIKKEIKFIRQQGKAYIDQVIKATEKWEPKKRSTLQVLLPIVIADAAFSDSPEFDVDSVSQAQVKHQNELIAQIQQLDFAMTPLMLKINAAIRKPTDTNMDELSGQGIQELNEIQSKQLSSYAEMAEMIEKSSK